MRKRVVRFCGRAPRGVNGGERAALELLAPLADTVHQRLAVGAHRLVERGHDASFIRNLRRNVTHARPAGSPQRDLLVRYHAARVPSLVLHTARGAPATAVTECAGRRVWRLHLLLALQRGLELEATRAVP